MQRIVCECHGGILGGAEIDADDSGVSLCQHEAEYGLGENNCGRCSSTRRHQISYIDVASRFGAGLAALEYSRPLSFSLIEIDNRALDNFLSAGARQLVQHR